MLLWGKPDRKPKLLNSCSPRKRSTATSQARREVTSRAYVRVYGSARRHDTRTQTATTQLIRLFGMVQERGSEQSISPGLPVSCGFCWVGDFFSSGFPHPGMTWYDPPVHTGNLANCNSHNPCVKPGHCAGPTPYPPLCSRGICSLMLWLTHPKPEDSSLSPLNPTSPRSLMPALPRPQRRRSCLACFLQGRVLSCFPPPPPPHSLSSTPHTPLHKQEPNIYAPTLVGRSRPHHGSKPSILRSQQHFADSQTSSPPPVAALATDMGGSA